MRISIFELEEWERPVFDILLGGHEVRFTDRPLTMASVTDHQDAEIVSTFIYSDLSTGVLQALPHLRMIATRSTGFDHIDMRHCREKSVVVSNVPVYGDSTVAEHVFGLLLTISHRLVDAIDRTRKGDFSLQGLRGFDLRGKCLGIVGMGSIGRCVAEIARGFRMDVVAFDLKPDEKFAAAAEFRYVSLDELLSTSDVVTLHVPANERTRHLISTDEFARMKRGVVLINTARGSVVNIRALVEAIANGTVSAAGLDVLPEEPIIREEAELLRSAFREQHNLETLLADHILLRLRNVVVTPHSAFNTREAVGRILETTLENVQSFVLGRPVNVVSMR